MTCTRRVRAAVMSLLVAVMFGSGLATSSAAMAATAQPAGSVKPSDVIYETHYRMVSKVNKGTFSGDWVHCVYVTKAKYHQTVSCSKGKTVSESVSGSVGFSKSVISSSVGFNVSYSTTVSSSISVAIKPGGYGWYDVGFRYRKWVVGMQQRTCIVETGYCFAWSSTDHITVQQHLGNTYHYFGTGAS